MTETATLDQKYVASPLLTLVQESASHRRCASTRVGEPAADPLSEADLAHIWAGQRFPAEALATPDGRRVRVHNPGRRNGGAGPDFRDAVLTVDGEERRGDVELHVRASAFRGHGHHQDAAYARIALHVVYRADDGLDTLLAGGGRAPVAAFAPWLEQRESDLARWLAQPPLWREPCRGAAERLGGDAIEAVLREAGAARFAAAVSRLGEAAGALGEAAAVWRAVFETLGAGGDRPGFRRLAQRFSPALAASVTEGLSVDAARVRLEHALLGVAGLRAPPAELAALLPPPLEAPLAGSGRPANRPERRLRGFVRLYVRARSDFAGYISQGVGRAESVKTLLADWQVADAGGGPALIGRERAQELLINVVLPFAATRDELAPKAEALAAALPALPPYGKTAFLEANLRGPDGKRPVRSALAQQGLLAFLGEWCSKDGCGRCPLS